MNVNQVINMIVRMVMRKAINKGINVGMGAGSKAGSQTQETDLNGRKTDGLVANPSHLKCLESFRPWP